MTPLGPSLLCAASAVAYLAATFTWHRRTAHAVGLIFLASLTALVVIASSR